MTALAGTGELTRLAARRDRILLPVWIYVLTAVVASTAYSQQLQAAGGTAPYAWKVTAGSLPAGLTLNSNGTISGTPKKASTATFTVQATDAGSHRGLQVLGESGVRSRLYFESKRTHMPR